MKFTPRSIAVRMMRVASSSDEAWAIPYPQRQAPGLFRRFGRMRQTAYRLFASGGMRRAGSLGTERTRDGSSESGAEE